MKQGTRALTSLLLVLAMGLLLGIVALNLTRGLSAAPAPAPSAPRALPPATNTALPPLDGSAPLPDPGALRTSLDQAFEHDGGGSFSGYVADAADGEALYDREGAGAAVPASSLKVATAAAALSVLGGDQTLRTTVVRGPDNSVVLVGGGDVLLGSGKSSASVVGRAGLATLAAETAEALLASGAGAEPAPPDQASPAPGGSPEDAEAPPETPAEPGDRPIGGELRVLLDDSLFIGAALHPRWHESLMASNNITAVQPLAVYGARVDAGANSPRSADPALAAAQVFRESLAGELAQRQTVGTLAVSEEVARGAAPDAAPELAAVESAALRDQLRFMAEESDNYVAEAVGRLVALGSGKPATFGGATEAVREALERLGVDTAGMSLVDSSGLSDANRMSPKQLVQTIRLAASSPDPALRDLTYLLPIAGATGTLDNRLGGDGTRGLVRAKTGTLTGVATLTGTVVTADGRLLVFSFFGQGFPEGLDPARAGLDRAAAALAGCGCRPG